jgi:hypothetical protein
MATADEVKAYLERSRQRHADEVNCVREQQERAGFNRRMLALETAAREFMKAADALKGVLAPDMAPGYEGRLMEAYGIARGRLDAVLSHKPEGGDQ